MRHERVLRGRVSSEHFVQLFDDLESLAEGVSTFLLDGWRHGEPLLVVPRPAHWGATQRLLEAQAYPSSEAMASGRLVVLDAATTLAAFVQNGRPVRDRFFASVGRVVSDLSNRFGTTLRIYGEMVDILAAQGELAAAHQLEELWNELGAAHPMRLMCGYAAGHFGDARSAGALRAICAAHDRATAPPDDLLANWLLAGRGPWRYKTA